MFTSCITKLPGRGIDVKKLLMCLVLLNTGCALASPPSTKFAVHVKDVETGIPITNAAIHTGFTQKYDPWGLGVGESTRINEQVDTDGIATFEGNTLGDERGGSVFAEGYYPQMFSMKYKKNVVLNRWEPWDPIIEVKMRKIKNPVPMIYNRIENKLVPVFDQPVGFDLEKSDWVAPHGKGSVSDFIYSASLVTQPKEGIRYSLTFSNPLDGLQEYVPPEDLRSSYIFPYEAPTNGYAATFNRYRLLKYPELPDYPANNLKEDKDVNYIFRVRTKVDNKGKIISAHYGRIQGEIRSTMKGGLYVNYWYNPEPNNRSLESDKKPY